MECVDPLKTCLETVEHDRQWVSHNHQKPWREYAKLIEDWIRKIPSGFKADPQYQIPNPLLQPAERQETLQQVADRIAAHFGTHFAESPPFTVQRLVSLLLFSSPEVRECVESPELSSEQKVKKLLADIERNVLVATSVAVAEREEAVREVDVKNIDKQSGTSLYMTKIEWLSETDDGDENMSSRAHVSQDSKDTDELKDYEAQEILESVSSPKKVLPGDQLDGERVIKRTKSSILEPIEPELTSADATESTESIEPAEKGDKADDEEEVSEMSIDQI